MGTKIFETVLTYRLWTLYFALVQAVLLSLFKTKDKGDCPYPPSASVRYIYRQYGTVEIAKAFLILDCLEKQEKALSYFHIIII